MQVDPSPVGSGPFVLRRRLVAVHEFVERWEPAYEYGKEELYDGNIGRPLTRTSVNELFEWKNGAPLSGRKKGSVESNYLSRLDELAQFDESISPEKFLARFERGGAIWRIFWLHIWLPNRFPIYDQHVHRAMEWIETGRPGEIPKADSAKIESYVSRFLPFYELFEGVERRRVDKALWACGKCMKTLRAAPIA